MYTKIELMALLLLTHANQIRASEETPLEIRERRELTIEEYKVIAYDGAISLLSAMIEAS